MSSFTDPVRKSARQKIRLYKDEIKRLKQLLSRADKTSEEARLIYEYLTHKEEQLRSNSELLNAPDNDPRYQLEKATYNPEMERMTTRASQVSIKYMTTPEVFSQYLRKIMDDETIKRALKRESIQFDPQSTSSGSSSIDRVLLAVVIVAVAFGLLVAVRS